METAMLGQPHGSSRRWAALLVLIGGFGFAACSSTAIAPDGGEVSQGGGDAGAGDLSTTVEGCAWPSSYLTPADFAASHCSHAARTVLSCTSATGSAACVTSDTECDTSNTNITGPFTCENHCASGEFAIACGDVGPAPTVPPDPPGCRGALFTPAGVTFYCCPCGSP